MINYNSNIGIIVGGTLNQITALRNNPDPILRTVALAVLPELKHRVHIEGKDSAGDKIGTYSKEYMVVRTGAYKNAEKFSKGAKKGELKNAGVYTKKGYRKYSQEDSETVTSKRAFAKTEFMQKARQMYNRSNDPTVILSLTRQMENDLSIIQTGNGYGIGYLNPLNYQKALWCEATYKKQILTKLTTGELTLVKSTAENFTPEYLKTLS